VTIIGVGIGVVNCQAHWRMIGKVMLA